MLNWLKKLYARTSDLQLGSELASFEKTNGSGASSSGPDIVNDPISILDAWTALEVLSPQSYKKPEDLAEGSAQSVIDLTRGLPWERQSASPVPSSTAYYEIVLGAVKLDSAAETLRRIFGDPRLERPRSSANAVLATFKVDQVGLLVDEDPVSVSSFGFGYKQARDGKLDTLKDWPVVEEKIVDTLTSKLTVYGDENNRRITQTLIMEAAKWLANEFDIPKDQWIAPKYAVKRSQKRDQSSPAQSILLSSFFLEDLGKARSLIKAGAAGQVLRRYLAIDEPLSQIDLLSDKDDKEAVNELLSPAKMPKARWPSPGLHSLVLLQQAAVNLSFTELEESGIAAVNGPPGTGKTTLLRDVVAGIVHTRASAMCAFDDPNDAFSVDATLRLGNARLNLYQLSESLRGHEILVASSNNKAVENVSKELPARAAIEETRAPQYFSSIADAVSGQDNSTWGLAAAVLGNRRNQENFRERFWWDKDRGLLQYLSACAGKEVKYSKRDNKTGTEITGTPQVIIRERPPTDRKEALRRWQRARQTFADVTHKTEVRLETLLRVRQRIEKSRVLRQQAKQSETKHQCAVRVLEAAQEKARWATAAHDESRVDLRFHKESRPRLFACLCQTTEWKAWWRTYKELRSRIKQHKRAKKDAKETLGHARLEIKKSEHGMNVAQRKRDWDQEALERDDSVVSSTRHELGSRFADERFWEASHENLQVSVAWLDEQTQALRDQCFSAAFDVHRAFIDVAEKPIRHNLGVLFGVNFGTGLSKEQLASLPSLWSTLFLVTPVVSTTFASVGRMLEPMPPESIGWLLIDEAGQAVPQAAIGALMRAKRAFVVGDPLQIEPVVTLSPSLTDNVCRRLGVDPDIWSAPKASAQTLADRASRYRSWIEKPEGCVLVGAPLLVHRRCEEPMFSIINVTSYARLMVRATVERPSRVRKVLGKSRWIDVRGGATGKWCAEEGEVVVRMLKELVKKGLEKPDIFCITPFRDVAQQLRRRMRSEHALLHKLSHEPNEWLGGRIGTVHTFQGKEAEAVILVLGAQGGDQTGVRLWAGSPANLINVAVSRAKQVLYVVGNRDVWSEAGNFCGIAKCLGVDRDDRRGVHRTSRRDSSNIT